MNRAAARFILRTGGAGSKGRRVPHPSRTLERVGLLRKSTQHTITHHAGWRMASVV